MINWVHNAWRRRKQAERISEFARLIASPFALGSAAHGNPLPNQLVMPGPGRLAVSTDHITVAGDLIIRLTDSGTENVGIPGGPANTIFRLHWSEEEEKVQVRTGATCPAGAVKLYILDEWQRTHIIATGTVT